jgi:hypothetical protein
MSASLLKRLAAGFLPADGELMKVAGNREEFLKLRRKSRIHVLSERDGESF